jgi:outer membrane protein TolC
MRGRLLDVDFGSSASRRSVRRWFGRRLLGWVVGSGVLSAVLAGGCSREYYRRDADQQAYQLIDEKESDPRWQLPDYSVYGDPRSRYFEPTNPDCPPIPPDDPASHEFMHCVYGKRGYARWHENGDLTELENPDWRNYLGDVMERRDDGTYTLELQDAVHLALLHSPRYQRNIESLYLSALDVSFERFRFDTQFFASNRTTFLHRGSEFIHRQGTVTGAGGAKVAGNSSSTLTVVNNAQASGPRTTVGAGKLFPAGGQLLVDFANTFVWQFAGSDQNTRADSLLSFTFIQPFLRRGGREVVMETLTRAERSLLANVRQMEFYRQYFLLDVAMGTGTTGGPSRQGGFQGGSGLTGFTGQGGGGFSGVGEGAGNFGRIGGTGGGGGGGGGGAGAGGFAGGVAGNVSGFIGLVQRAQQIRNSEANLEQQLDNLERTEALFAAGRIDSLQVDQFRQNVQTTQSQLLASRNTFQNALENYLIQTLGLPPDLPVRIDESIVEPFQFSEPRLRELQNRLKRLITQTRTDESPSIDVLRQTYDSFRQMRGPIAERFEVVRNDFRRLDSVQSERLQTLSDDVSRKEFEDQLAKLTEDFQQLEKRFAATEPGAAAVERLLTPNSRDEAQQEIIAQTDAMAEILRELVFVQAGVRLESVVLPPVEISPDDAFRIALANRLDIMNQRAEVVDQWRLIAFNADRLESDLDVMVTGDIGTLDRNIVNFRDQTGSFTFGLRFDSPITRLDERNIYRQSLIDYQRVRRDYIQTEDSLKRTLRQTLSAVQLFATEIEQRRKAMRIALRTMDLTQERLQEPPRAGAAGQAGLGQNVVRDLLQAFSDILTTQNDIMNTYLNYQQFRMVLYRDLGIIQFDENGMWIDEPLEQALKRASAVAETELPPLKPAMAEVRANSVPPSVRPASKPSAVSEVITTQLNPAPAAKDAAPEPAPAVVEASYELPAQPPVKRDSKIRILPD